MNTFSYLILSPRCIPEVLNAFQSMIDTKIWLKGFREYELKEHIQYIVSITNFDYYMICADDIVPTQNAIDNIKSIASLNHIATGYSELIVGDCHVNLSASPLKISDSPVDIDYDFITFEDIKQKDNVFQTYYAGFSATCIPRHILLDTPIDVTSISKNSSDYIFSVNMYQKNIKILSHKNGYIRHLKAHNMEQYWYDGPKQILIQR